MEFNINRFFNLIRRDYYIYRKGILWFILSLFLMVGLIMIITALGTLGNRPEIILNPNGDFTNVLTIIILVVGIIFSLVNFWEFKSHFGRHNYLALPASHFEKFVSHLIYTTIGYLVLAIGVYYLSYHLFGFVVGVISNASYGPFELLHEDLNLSFGKSNYTHSIGLNIWFLFQSFAFLCAVMFNRYAPVKAVVLWNVIIILLGIIGAIIIYIIFIDFADGWSINIGQEHRPSQEWLEWTGQSLGPFLLKILFYAVPPFLWIVSYFKLTEKEA